MSRAPKDSGPPDRLFRVGALPLMVLLPAAVCYLWICARHHGGALVLPTSADELGGLITHLPRPTLRAAAILLGWLAFQAALAAIVPGPRREGFPLADGSRLVYRLNGLACFAITLAALGGGVALGWVRPAAIRDELGPLIACGILFAYGFGAVLYALGRLGPDRGRELRGGPVFRYFAGVARNPRLLGFDVKLFFEARPGLIGWVAIDLGLAAAQYELHGLVSAPMVLVCAFQLFYVADYFVHEEAILSTWDVRHESFGWMLLFGDLVWVPCTYSLQALYLVARPGELSLLAAAGIVALNLLGYAIFRGANLQKHRFKRDPSRAIWGKPAAFVETGAGTRLLASGWWGLARHMNYLGDWLMAAAWCVACGFDHLLPYFYAIYFAALLVHRERRDNAACLARYGDAWREYSRRVRWRIVPWIY